MQWRTMTQKLPPLPHDIKANLQTTLSKKSVAEALKAESGLCYLYYLNILPFVILKATIIHLNIGRLALWVYQYTHYVCISLNSSVVL